MHPLLTPHTRATLNALKHTCLESLTLSQTMLHSSITNIPGYMQIINLSLANIAHTLRLQTTLVDYTLTTPKPTDITQPPHTIKLCACGGQPPSTIPGNPGRCPCCTYLIPKHPKGYPNPDKCYTCTHHTPPNGNKVCTNCRLFLLLHQHSIHTRWPPHMTTHPNPIKIPKFPPIPKSIISTIMPHINEGTILHTLSNPKTPITWEQIRDFLTTTWHHSSQRPNHLLTLVHHIPGKTYHLPTIQSTKNHDIKITLNNSTLSITKYSKDKTHTTHLALRPKITHQPKLSHHPHHQHQTRHRPQVKHTPYTPGQNCPLACKPILFFPMHLPTGPSQSPMAKHHEDKQNLLPLESSIHPGPRTHHSGLLTPIHNSTDECTQNYTTEETHNTTQNSKQKTTDTEMQKG